MDQLHQDIYTEPSNIDVDTLSHLAPLRRMAGALEGNLGQSEPVHHTDCNHLKKIAEPVPNPVARK